MARILTPHAENLRICAEALQRGEIVAIPTETVYGLAANATSTEAVRKIFEAKERPLEDPLIVHLPPDYPLSQIAEPTPLFEKLRPHLWPGPVTFILPKKNTIPSLTTAGQPSVAVRCPAHPVMLELLRLGQIPLAAPSANPFGYISPTTAHHVAGSMGDRLDLILDGGPCEVGFESTILDVRREDHIRILRPGALNPEDLETIARVPVLRPSTSPESGPIEAPGTLLRHYSPRLPLSLHQDLSSLRPQPGYGYLFYQKPSPDWTPEGPSSWSVSWLTEQGSPEEAGRNLYACLRQLDQSATHGIHAERIPPGGLSEALNDRLQRAAAS